VTLEIGLEYGWRCGERGICERINEKELIAQALPYLRFEPIAMLFYCESGEEIESLAPQLGLLVSWSRRELVMVGASRALRSTEVWLYPDGTLHQYLELAAWETPEGGCTQRQYIGAVGEDRVSFEQIREQIRMSIAAAAESDAEEDSK
jgi:hypothetical protein